MRITTKMMLGAIVLTAGAVLLAAGATGWLAVRGGAAAIEKPIADQFRAVASGREQRLLATVRSVQDLLLSQAHGQMVQDAVYGMLRPYASYRYEVPSISTDALRTELDAWYREAYAELYRRRSGGQALPVSEWLGAMSHEALLLQRYYMADNPHPADALWRLSDRADATIYGQQHRRYHDSFRDIVQRFGFNDLMLIDARSRVVMYSVAKGPLFATSLRDGPFADSALAALVDEALAAPADAQVHVSPFAANAARFNEQAVFVAVPVYHAAHSPERPLGVLVAELPASLFTRLMTDGGAWAEAGLGESGEAYLVAADGRVLTELRPMLEAPQLFLHELRALRPEDGAAIDEAARLGALSGRLRLSSPAVAAALAGDSGSGLIADYRGREVLAAWTPLQLGRHRYALITQQDPAEVYAPLAELRRSVLTSVPLATLLLSLLAALGSYLFAQALGSPLRALATAIQRAAARRDLSGDFASRRRDEIGMIGSAVDELFVSLRPLLGRIGSMAHETAQAADGSVVISEQCRRSVHGQRLALQRLHGETDEAQAAAARIAAEMSGAAEAAATAAEHAGRGQQQVSGVAGLMRELSADIAASGESVAGLQEATEAIGGVLDTIRSIAEQTNLLALNAAIEAARAGAQGRGFAVVAGEVRALAASSQEAAGSIRGMIEHLRENMHEVAAAIERERSSAERCGRETAEAEQALSAIGRSAEQIRETTARVAADVELQHAQTEQIRSRLQGVLTEADRTDEAMEHLAATACAQQRLAAELDQAAGRFTLGEAQAA